MAYHRHCIISLGCCLLSIIIFIPAVWYSYSWVDDREDDFTHGDCYPLVVDDDIFSDTIVHQNCYTNANGLQMCSPYTTTDYGFRWQGYIAKDPVKRTLSSKYESSSRSSAKNMREKIEGLIVDKHSVKCHYEKDFSQMSLDPIVTSSHVVFWLVAILGAIIVIACSIWCIVMSICILSDHKKFAIFDAKPYH